jgi:hypothetical protein
MWLTLILTLLALPLQAQRALAGGDVSGGGTYVQVPGGFQLLDLYLEGAPRAGAGHRLPDSPALKQVGMDRLFARRPELKVEVMERLHLWRNSSPEIVGLLESALAQAEHSFFYTDHAVAKLESYFIPPEREIARERLLAAAVYHKEIGTVISREAFEASDRRSQVALLIHELLRHVQIRYGLRLSDKSVQALTAKLAARQPAGESLDEAPYLDGPLLEQIRLRREAEREVLRQLERLRTTSASDLVCLPDTAGSAPQDQLFSLAQAGLSLAEELRKEGADKDYVEAAAAATRASALATKLSAFASERSLDGVRDVNQRLDNLQLLRSIDRANRGQSTGGGPSSVEGLIRSGLLKKAER